MAKTPEKLSERYLRQAVRPSWCYGVALFLARLVGALLFRLRVSGREHLPKGQAFLICSNHASYLDPPLVGAALGVIYFFARNTLFRGFLGWLLPRLNAIPIDRDRPDLAGIRTTLNVLKAGKPVLLFPEGTRTRDGGLQPARRGVGLFVAKAGVPVLPVRIFGSFEAWPRGGGIRPHTIQIVVGAPLHQLHTQVPDGVDAYQWLADRVMRAIAAIEPPASGRD
jgi:1-acyl-sn-glycerol-3-phosphate acyltransferase